MDFPIFISYSRTDGAFALRLHDSLRKIGLNAWLDAKSIRGGDLWDEAVESALKHSSVVIVVLSPESVRSRSVLDEVFYALDEAKVLVPVMYKRCDVPFRLRRLHYTDFTSEFSSAFAQLAETLATRGLSVPPAHSPTPTNGEDKATYAEYTGDVQGAGTASGLAKFEKKVSRQQSEGVVATDGRPTRTLQSSPSKTVELRSEGVAPSNRAGRKSSRRFSNVTIAGAVLMFAAGALIWNVNPPDWPNIPPRRSRRKSALFMTAPQVPESWSTMPELKLRNAPHVNEMTNLEEAVKALRGLKSKSGDIEHVKVRPKPVYEPVPSIRLAADYVCNVNLMISASGSVTSVEMCDGPSSLTKPLTAAVLTWRFKPATDNGVPVPASFMVAISFHAK
jgi:hypothetical protein